MAEIRTGGAQLEVVEICAGAGGQALGLERAGFEHVLAVEIDETACATLRHNRPGWKVAEGDVTDPELWRPRDYRGVALLAGGVPCPPFTVAGKQLGEADSRNLVGELLRLAAVIRPAGVLMENVRGFTEDRFQVYRDMIEYRLEQLGYQVSWRILYAADYGVPQFRPRFVLVALQQPWADRFRWPAPSPVPPPSVGITLHDLMSARGWPGADRWRDGALRTPDGDVAVAPTLVGGSRLHGGPDLGPTRAKRAWLRLGVDAMGVADEAPGPEFPVDGPPRLTVEMAALIQGFPGSWQFIGSKAARHRPGRGKTARYRQVGNAFPPQVAEGVGRAIAAAFDDTSVVR